MSNGFTATTRSEPCDVCGKAGWCVRSERTDGYVCMRSDGRDHNGIRPKQIKYTNGQVGWMYNPSAPLEPTVGTSLEAGPPEVLHRVYSALSAACRPDREKLVAFVEKRGLDENVADRLLNEGYAELDRNRLQAVRQLIDQGHETDMARTPGFFIDDRSGFQRWSLAGASGILCPARNIDGQIVGFQIRAADTSNGRPKYTWLSSKSKGASGPGAPIHVPRFDGDTSTIRVTEGVLKSEIATHLSGVLTLGVAGTGWSGLNDLVPTIGPKRLLIAYDADYRSNDHVVGAIIGILKAAAGWKVEAFVEYWAPEEAKGIDDALSAKVPVMQVPGQQFIDRYGSRQSGTVQAGRTLRQSMLDYLSRDHDEGDDLLSTGIDGLDQKLNGGLGRQEFVVIGARPSHGKSALGMQLLHAFAQQGVKSLFVSGEMPEPSVVKRSLSHVSDVEPSRWRFERERLQVDVERHFKSREAIHVEYFDTGSHIDDVFRTCEQYKHQFGIEAVLIDYAQLFTGRGRGSYESNTYVSKAIQRVSRKLGLLTVALAQVGRDVEKRRASSGDVTRFLPSSHDLKESGQYEQDADVILFGMMPLKYNPAHKPHNDYVISVTKNRERGTDQSPFIITFDPSRMTFRERWVGDAVDSPKRYAVFDNFNNAFDDEF